MARIPFSKFGSDPDYMSAALRADDPGRELYHAFETEAGSLLIAGVLVSEDEAQAVDETAATSRYGEHVLDPDAVR